VIATPFTNVDPESEIWRDVAAQQSTALVLGSFTADRHLCYANVGMRRLLKLDEGPFDAASFRSPSFSSFLSHAPSNKPVYSGLITIQVGHDAGVSIRAAVFHTSNGIHVIGEYDVTEMAAVNEQMHELNREVTRLHRESARQPRELQGALHELQENQDAREKLQRELLDASRRAGRAEVAVGVLHNVGNALNSVVVSAASVAETVQAGQLNALEKVVHTLQRHQNDLPAFMASMQGQRMLPYLRALSERMLDERQRLLKESRQIDERLATLKSLVDEHQKYGRQTTVYEVVDPVQLVDEMWPLVVAANQNSGVDIARGNLQAAPVLTDSFRLRGLFQDLVSIAVSLAGSAADSARVVVTVSDAPSPALLIAIPQVVMSEQEIDALIRQDSDHASTVNLHSSANAVTEMNGQLEVLSDPETGTAIVVRFQSADAAVQMAASPAAIPHAVDETETFGRGTKIS